MNVLINYPFITFLPRLSLKTKTLRNTPPSEKCYCRISFVPDVSP